MFENLSKEELIKLLQSKNKENSELQEKLKLKDDELQQKSEELQQTNDELQQKSEELQLASDELQQTQTELESIKSFCAENHQKVVQLIVNSKVRLESYSNSDLYPDSCDYEQFLAFEFRLVKSLIANNLRLSGLHAKQFVPSSEKMGYPGNTKKNNEPENEPAESVGTISKDTSPEEGSGPKQAAEYLSKEEQAYNVAVGAVKTIFSTRLNSNKIIKEKSLNLNPPKVILTGEPQGLMLPFHLPRKTMPVPLMVIKDWQNS